MDGSQQKIRVIITGASGMVGEGVLNTCLESDEVDEILVVGRRPCGMKHPKLKELIHGDFFDMAAIESQLAGYNACYFCLGVSSVGMKEPEYFKLTHTLTVGFAETVSRVNHGMTFCYVSGYGTDGSEKGRIMWARVKGKTENDLGRLPFNQVFNFRPFYMNPTKGLKHTLKGYRYITWMYPALRFLFPNYISTLEELGQAMIFVTRKGYPQSVLEVQDMVKCAKKGS